MKDSSPVGFSFSFRFLHSRYGRLTTTRFNHSFGSGADCAISLLKGKSPTYGPVTARLVEYGIAHLSQEHMGQIYDYDFGNELVCGSAFEEVWDSLPASSAALPSPLHLGLRLSMHPFLGERNGPHCRTPE